MLIDDVSIGFDFTELFSVITESVSVDKKNEKPFIIPFEQSPVILISSNYPITGSNSSHNRRRFEFELINYYSDKHQPYDDFGIEFFHDWKEEDWKYFDRLMLNCIEVFLKNGLIKTNNKTDSTRLLLKETSKQFTIWALEEDLGSNPTNLPLGVKLNKVSLRRKFSADTGINLTAQKFRRFLETYVSINRYNLEILKSDGIEYFIINLITHKTEKND